MERCNSGFVGKCVDFMNVFSRSKMHLFTQIIVTVCDLDTIKMCFPVWLSAVLVRCAVCACVQSHEPVRPPFVCSQDQKTRTLSYGTRLLVVQWTTHTFIGN